MAKNSVAKSIDIRRNNGAVTAVSFGGGGGGSVDTSGFLLLDGSRPMAGVLDMGTFAITNVGNVDGIDISAHAANANAHHNQIHVLANAGGLGGDHTITGGVAGYVLRVTGTTTAAIAQLQHSDLGGVTADQHHAQQHSIIGSDHTITGSQALDLVGVPTTTNVLGIVRPSNNVTTNVAAILATNASGQTTVKGLTGTTYVQSNAYISAGTYADIGTYVNTPRITAPSSLLVNPSSDITLEPGGAVTLQDAKSFNSASSSSGWTGTGFQMGTTGGKSYLEVDNLTVRGTMRVYELVIQRIRATNGAIAVTSTGKLESFTGTSPNYTITTTEDHGFAAGDLIRAQTWTGTNIYRSDLTVVALDATTPLRKFTATRRSGSSVPFVGAEYVRIGSTSDTARQGLLYLTADEVFGPYMDVVNGVNTFAKWEDAGSGKIKMRIGNLQGVTSTAGEYGFIATDGVYTSGDTSNTKWIRASSAGFELRNVGISIWSAATERVSITPSGTLTLKNASGVEKLSWDGSALTVDGSGTFSGSITATSGAIGGWSITSTQIQSNNGRIILLAGGSGVARLEVLDSTTANTYSAGIVSRTGSTGIAIWAGSTFANINNAPFKVLMDGSVTMTSATIKNGTSPTMQLDEKGIHFVPDGNWGETKGYMFRSALGGTTALGGMFGNYTAAGNFSTGVWANTVDGASAAVSNLDANVYITALSASTKNSQIALKVSKVSATSSITVTTATASPGNGSNKIIFDAENGAGKVAVYRSSTYYEVWDDYYASTKALVYSDATNVTFTGTGYLQTSQKLGTAWTAFTVSTQFNVIGGALYWKKFGDLVILRGFLDWDNSPAKTILVSSADFPAAIRPTYEVNLWAHLSDGTMVKITIPTSGNVTCNIAINKETQNLHIDNLCYTIS